MNDQELKKIWRGQKLDAPPSDARADLEAIRDKMSKLRHTLRWRDVQEFAACVVVIAGFIAWYVAYPYSMARIGALINIIGAMTVAGMLIESWCSPRPNAAAPVAQWIEQQRQYIHREAELLRTVLWWYLLPFWLGTNIAVWGLPGRPSTAKAAFTIVFTLVNVWIYFLNRSARRTQLLPIQHELDTLLNEESQAGPPKNQAFPTVARGNRSKGAWIILALLIAVYAVLTAAWNAFTESPREASLRPPEFGNVSGLTHSDLSRIDAWLQEQVALARYPSLSVAIVRDGRITYERAFGFENIEEQRIAAPETSYAVASVTKVFTASLAAMLHASGTVDLDQPVVNYLPKDVSISTRPALGATITLRQLASHTSGLPRGVPGEVQSVEGRYQLEPERLYALLADVKLEFEPGTDRRYSNLGFGLLGHALAQAAGKPFEQLLQEMLFDPLRLEGTSIQVHDKLRLATGYDGSRREDKHSYRKRLAPSGGLIASAPDLARFLAAQMKPGLFSTEMLQQLHTETKLSNGSGSGTTLGWTEWRILNYQVRILEKNGGRNNCSAWIGFAPEHGVGVAVVTNCGGPDVDPIGHWLLERSMPGAHDTLPKSE